MTKRLFILTAIACCLLSCHNQPPQPQAQHVAEEEPYDWTPEGFKRDHYDEWQVVYPAVTLQQQQQDSLDYSRIDTLVRDYIRRKQIALPSDPYAQILRIDQICDSAFDISGYDESNFGMHITDGTARLFDWYIDWLLCNAAQKACPNIDFGKEKAALKPVIDAYMACCDSIGLDFEGSAFWYGLSDVDHMELQYLRSLYDIVLAPSHHETLPLLLTPAHFEAESKKRLANYKQPLEEYATSEQVAGMLRRFDAAVTRWLVFRDSVESTISDTELRNEYSYVTRSFAKTLFVHLKNNFGDIGLYSESMYERCFLHTDCSDEQMLKYSYEEALKRYMKQ